MFSWNSSKEFLIPFSTGLSDNPFIILPSMSGNAALPNSHSPPAKEEIVWVPLFIILNGKYIKPFVNLCDIGWCSPLKYVWEDILLI